jgi:hypothetical protein
MEGTTAACTAFALASYVYTYLLTPPCSFNPITIRNPIANTYPCPDSSRWDVALSPVPAVALTRSRLIAYTHCGLLVR